MNIFQLIALPLLMVLLLMSLRRIRSGGRGRRVALLQALIWLSAAVAVAIPDSTMRAANALGIGRGTDLVLYLLVIGQFIVWFHFFQRVQKLESEISETVRQLAVRDGLAIWPAHSTHSDGSGSVKPESRRVRPEC
ncbi:MAG: DUF2304 family protein [Chloroflexota bacterium]